MGEDRHPARLVWVGEPDAALQQLEGDPDPEEPDRGDLAKEDQPDEKRGENAGAGDSVGAARYRTKSGLAGWAVAMAVILGEVCSNLSAFAGPRAPARLAPGTRRRQ